MILKNQTIKCDYANFLPHPLSLQREPEVIYLSGNGYKASWSSLNTNS